MSMFWTKPGRPWQRRERHGKEARVAAGDCRWGGTGWGHRVAWQGSDEDRGDEGASGPQVGLDRLFVLTGRGVDGVKTLKWLAG
jgi:hypothetical protein